jgi:hypothetical protein
MKNTIEAIRQLNTLPVQEKLRAVSNALRWKIRHWIGGTIYSTFGYWVNRANSRYMIEIRPEFHRDFSRVKQYRVLFRTWVTGNRRRNGGDLARFYTLYLNLHQTLTDAVLGDVVELGVYKGNSASMLAAFSREHRRHLYLFDTFEGFDDRDLHADYTKKSRLFADTSVTKVQALVGSENITFVKGFFPQSTSNMKLPEAIAFGHIDCDLYDPVKAGLELFFPRLSPGGMLIFHDYASGHWPGVKRAVDEFFADKPEKPVIIPDKSGSAIVRKTTVPFDRVRY